MRGTRLIAAHSQARQAAGPSWHSCRNPARPRPTLTARAPLSCQVRGLGETIVSGTVPGAALTFVARKDDIENPKVGGTSHLAPHTSQR